jgi:adenosylmethionine-8-amino-7-oxononanoate aminotransferase
MEYNTDDLKRKDIDHNIHPWTNFATFKEEGSLVMAKSNGNYVYDTEGNKYLDGIAGLWCVNIGYRHHTMVKAIADQINEITYYTTFGHVVTPPAAELAAKIAELAPGDLNHTFFGTGGSMSNDTAIRIIHFYFNRLGKPNKKKIISRVSSYHGSTYLAMTLTGEKADHIGFDLAKDLVYYVSAPNCYRRPDGTTLDQFCDQLVEEFENKILELGEDNVAAFIAEPIMGAGGVIVAPPGYHKRMKEVCEKYGMLYISDEVVTAFGRLGHFFASEEVFNIVPDIITSAKGISSGYVPLSATILSDKIYDVISDGPQEEGALFTHGFTYAGHPVSCAAGLANIRIMEEGLICDHVQQIGPYFKSQLETLSDLDIVGDVRGSHFMLCVENVKDKKTKELFDASVNIGKRIAVHCQSRGVIVRPIGHLNVLSPPLTLSRDEIDILVSTLRESIEATMDDLARE